jgi:hypothetical protein
VASQKRTGSINERLFKEAEELKSGGYPHLIHQWLKVPKCEILKSWILMIFFIMI